MAFERLKFINPIEDQDRPNNYHIKIVGPPGFEELLKERKFSLGYYQRDLSGTLEEAQSEARNLVKKFYADMAEEAIPIKDWRNRIVCSVYASFMAYEIT